MSPSNEPYKEIAQEYDEIRPSYPEALIDDVIVATSLNSTHEVLEIGAGTGKATVQFANKGYAIHAIEIGEDMGVLLREKCLLYPNVSVEICSFEDWMPSYRQQYDLIFSAQAFHWLNPDIKYKKCYNLLRDGGFLALFWYTASGTKTEQAKRIEQEMQLLMTRYARKISKEPDKPMRSAHSGVFANEERRKEIEASNLFAIVSFKHYRLEVKNTPEQFLKAQHSVPAFASIRDGLDETARKRMDDEIQQIVKGNGGYVATVFDYSLFVAKKIDKSF